MGGEAKLPKPQPDYRFPDGDKVAAAIGAWWIRKENEHYLPGTVASSYALADYLRELDLVK